MPDPKSVQIRDKATISVIRRWQRKTKPRTSLSEMAARLVLAGDAAEKQKEAK